MAEYSGFFQAQWDDELQNPTTGEYTGWWDRNYIAQQFANYFALFIGNGVFGSPTNQLQVIPGTGLTVVVKPGWAFINGYWYHNSENLVLSVPANSAVSNRVDSVRLRYNDTNRTVSALYFTGDTTNVRGETIYDLKLAEVIVPPSATGIAAQNVTDTRTNEAVCGLVKGLMEVETTADLFAQYTAQFNAWFDGIKDQLTGDLAVRLQLEFEELNENVVQYKSDTDDAINDFEASVGNTISTYQSQTAQQITDYQNNISNQISGYNTNYQSVLNATQAAAQTAQGLVTDYVNNDFVISEQTLTFTNKVCTIQNNKVTSDSLIDVYFTADTISNASKAGIIVDSNNGSIVLTADRQPTGTIKAAIRVRVR